MQPQQRHARRGSSASPARQQLYRHARARSQVAAPRRSLVASSSSLQQQQQQQRPRHSSLADDFLTSAESRAHSCDTSDRSHQHNKMNDNDNNSTGGHTATAPSRRSSDGGGSGVVNEDVVVHDVYPRYRIAAGIRAAAVVRRRCKHNNNNNNDDDDDDDDSVVWTAESDGALCIRALPRGAVRRRLPGREGTYATCLLYVPDKSSNNNSNNNNDNDTSSSSRVDSDASSAAWQQQQSPVSTAAAAGDDGVSSARHHHHNNSDGGRVWVGMCDGYMRIYDANTAQLVCEHVHHCGAVYSMLELEGAVYTAAQDWKVHQWRARDGAYVRLFAGHRGSVRCLAAYTGPTGAVLFSGSDDGAVRAWNPYTPLLAATTSPASAAALRQAACLHVFAAPTSSSCDGDTTTPSPRVGGSGVRALLVVPHASQLWAGHEGGVVRVWDLATLRCVRECAAHRATLTSLCVVATRVWSADAHDRVLLWDMHTLTPIQDITTTAATAAAATSPSQHAIWSLTAVQSCTVWRVWTTTASGVVQCYHAETRPFVTRAQQPQQQRQERQQQNEREVNFCHDANGDTSSSSPAVHVALDDGATRVSLLPSSSSQPVSAAAQTPATTTTTTHAALTAMIDTLPTSVRAYVAALRGERDAAQHTCAQLRARARDAATQQTATLHVMQTELELLRAQLQRSKAQQQQQQQRPQPSTARASVSPSSSVVVPSALLLPVESAASSSCNNNNDSNNDNNTNATATKAAAKHADVVTQLRAQADDDDALLHDGGVRAHVILQNAQAELARVQHDMEQANDDDDEVNEDNCAAVQVRRTRDDDDDERKHSSSRARTSGLLADDVRAAEDAASQMRTRHHELEQYMRTQLQPQLASLQRSCASAQLQLRQSERRYAALQAKYDALQQQQQQRQPRDSGGSNNKVATTSATARA